jgi:hypothetical protein
MHDKTKRRLGSSLALAAALECNSTDKKLNTLPASLRCLDWFHTVYTTRNTNNQLEFPGLVQG